MAWLQRATKLLRIAALDRLLVRSVDLPDALVHAIWTGEAVAQLAKLIHSRSAATAERLDVLARRLFAHRASRLFEPLPPAVGRGIYHYRSGFGGVSVEAARQRGWLCLCDHSMVHPGVVAHLFSHNGTLPPTGQTGRMGLNLRSILADVERADHVLVNSEFVKSTFLHQGWADDGISVIPQGVDDGFLSVIPERAAPEGPLRMLFAGFFSRGKGGHVLSEALRHLDAIDWRLDICGPVDADSAADLKRLAADARISYLGSLLPPALAARMAAADIFVFPTLAEGSARVVFEALAAGCYVVTTVNAGSIVVDGEHGRLIEPGNAHALTDALRQAARNRKGIARVGANNAALIRRSHRQQHYGDRLFCLYRHLLERSNRTTDSGEIAVP